MDASSAELLLAAEASKLKALLMDQTFIAGIGNIYSDEILWQPACATTARPSTLSTQEIRRLYRAMVETLHEAIKHRGLDAGRPAVRRPLRPPGEYQIAAPGLRPRGPGLPPLPGRRSSKAKFAGRSHLLLRACQV